MWKPIVTGIPVKVFSSFTVKSTAVTVCTAYFFEPTMVLKTASVIKTAKWETKFTGTWEAKGSEYLLVLKWFRYTTISENLNCVGCETE